MQAAQGIAILTQVTVPSINMMQMSGAKGPVNVFEGPGIKIPLPAGEQRKPIDDHFIPFCKDQDTLKTDTVMMMAQYLEKGSDAKVPDMPHNCKRFDGSPCAATDYNGCWNIPETAINPKAITYTICGPFGASVPKQNVFDAMGVLGSQCEKDGKVGGVIQLTGEISIRLSPVP